MEIIRQRYQHELLLWYVEIFINQSKNQVVTRNRFGINSASNVVVSDEIHL